MTWVEKRKLLVKVAGTWLDPLKVDAVERSSDGQVVFHLRGGQSITRPCPSGEDTNTIVKNLFRHCQD